MTVESATYISQLDPSLPASGAPKSEGDNHLRLLKSVLQTQFPNFGTNAITASYAEVNYLVGVTSAIQGQIDAKGAISGQAWTGTHNFIGATITVPTATAGDSSTKAASTAFVAGVAFSSALPGQAGNTNKFTRTDGTTASWAYPELKPQRISTNTTAVPGVHYIFEASCKLTLPTSWADGDAVAFSNASGGLITGAVDFGSTKLQGQSPGLMDFNTLTASGKVVYYSGGANPGLAKA